MMKMDETCRSLIEDAIIIIELSLKAKGIDVTNVSPESWLGKARAALAAPREAAAARCEPATTPRHPSFLSERDIARLCGGR